jgi:hypothetical protein
MPEPTEPQGWLDKPVTGGWWTLVAVWLTVLVMGGVATYFATGWLTPSPTVPTYEPAPESAYPPPFNIYNSDWWHHGNTVAAALDARPPEDPTWAERIEALDDLPIEVQYEMAIEACRTHNGGRVTFDGRVVDCVPDGAGGFTFQMTRLARPEGET